MAANNPKKPQAQKSFAVLSISGTSNRRRSRSSGPSRKWRPGVAGVALAEPVALAPSAAVAGPAARGVALVGPTARGGGTVAAPAGVALAAPVAPPGAAALTPVWPIDEEPAGLDSSSNSPRTLLAGDHSVRPSFQNQVIGPQLAGDGQPPQFHRRNRAHRFVIAGVVPFLTHGGSLCLRSIRHYSGQNRRGLVASGQLSVVRCPLSVVRC